ncbi:MAG: hypothetical protein IKY83_00945, partial [Proteobacteria bacterium]|nr:hypothetical protein [Pseudomonadota bacterium]
NGLKSNNAVVTLYAFKEKSFAYTGGLQEIALLPGKYKLEVNGSQGTAGWSGGVVGKGGYSYGTYQLTSAKTLYVCVGGNAYHEATNAGGYNGGGYGHARSGGARGGGATHIAIAKRGNGTLREYASYKSEVLIVAGGAGGVEWAGTGGAGGGATGGLGTSSAALGTAGTQSAGGTSAGYPGGPSVLYNGGFGYGGYGYRSDVTTYGWEGDYGAGGGGGWYGGGGTSYAGAGSGGSGYIGGVTSGGMVTGQNASVGSAKITLLD